MLKGKAKRSLAFVLAACMLLALLPSFGAGASAASVSYTEVDPSVIDAGAAVLQSRTRSRTFLPRTRRSM